MACTGKTIGTVMAAPTQRVRDLARGREGVISFAQGLPWFGPPGDALERTLERLRRGEGDAYSPGPGRERLREMLAADLRRRGAGHAAPDTVLLTPGANQAACIALAVLADRGDEVLLCRPHYFNHLMALQLLGLKPVLVDRDADGAIDVGRVRRRLTRRTRALIVVSPDNPSGAMTPGPVWDGLLELARAHRLTILADEAYRDFAWDQAHVSPLAADGENVVGLFSCSKSYGMAGWRLGYMCAPRERIAAALKAADTLHICPPQPAQILAEEILGSRPDYPLPFGPELRESRDRLVAALRPLHEQGLLGPLRSAGGFYLFVEIRPRRPLGGWELARRLIEEHGLATLPGEAFGMETGPWLRLSYGNIRAAAMAAAAEKLAAALADLLPR